MNGMQHARHAGWRDRGRPAFWVTAFRLVGTIHMIDRLNSRKSNPGVVSLVQFRQRQSRPMNEGTTIPSITAQIGTTILSIAVQRCIM